MNLFSLKFWLDQLDVKLSLGGGGNNGGGTTKFEWNDTLAPYWKSALGQADTLSKAPQPTYTGQRLAGLGDQDTKAAYDMIRNVTNNGGPQGNEARTMLTDTMKGSYSDPWAQAMVTPSSNEYMGESPYYNSVLQKGIGDITSAYKDATAPGTNAAYVMNGTFGGGDWQRQKAKDEDVLGRNLSSYVSQMGNTNYDRSAQLREAGLGREMSADTLNKQAGVADWNAERDRQMGSVAPGLQTEKDALAGANVRMGLGDVTRQDTQANLNQQYTDWLTQQNYPKDQLGWMTQFLTGAQGGLGPNQATTYSGAQTNPYSSILGTALGAYGMFRA